ncbi:hypothetical protein Scep_030012 [Stephania cephalantha]|uniref:Uncharacterized protein n=1 Tax=Stephania cephalantha TaxID=152367 RepID=A0AAP0DYZ9_9MAGN
MSSLVQFARYISAPIALKYGTSDQVALHHFHEVEMDPYPLQVIRQPLESSMDAPCPYKIFLIFFQYNLIDGQVLHLKNVQFANQDKVLFFQVLSSRIPFSSIRCSNDVVVVSHYI